MNSPLPAGGPLGAEHARLIESAGADAPWRLWGPYLSGRQWGTVREDYSAEGNAWSEFPFDHAVSRAYRWGEDGLGGISDRFGFLNVAVALWNGKDPILKERLFGLTNEEGNHGEDAKEYWWAIDGTPTHSWMQWLYRYPQAEFPYEQLRRENRERTRHEREFELGDTGILDDHEFFDVMMTYAKAGPDDVCIRITATNHGPEAAPLHVLPTIWLRNTWSGGLDDRVTELHEIRRNGRPPRGFRAAEVSHGFLGHYVVAAAGSPTALFCDNETNAKHLFGEQALANQSMYPKDAINQRVVHGRAKAVNAKGYGSKCSFWYRFDSIAPGETVTVDLRLATTDPSIDWFGEDFEAVMDSRRAEADEFYGHVIHPSLSESDRHVARRAYAGLLWGKQLYRYDVARWMEGDPAAPPPPASRLRGRNEHWKHLALADVISMPDEWEYPWFAAWDLAFHTIPLAHVDPEFAKEQLVLMCREWAMHPNGQLPAYEWEFGDVNPPVHAWAAWRVFKIEKKRRGVADRRFL
ncbi:MAG TPA: glucosidase, partial [Humibacillus sp.]|nr:glucosidase [Humibacillus sp.]